MDILFLLIPISVVLVFVIAVMFWWFVRSGQFDDLEGPGFRVLMDDDGPVDERPAAEGDASAKGEQAVRKS
jgi:cbb3-type cytochrome oxidase maturation protein